MAMTITSRTPPFSIETHSPLPNPNHSRSCYGFRYPKPPSQHPTITSSIPRPSIPLPSAGNPTHPNSMDFAGSSGLGSGTGGEEPAHILKRPRLFWTPQLHKSFLDAVAHLTMKNVVPKTMMQLMRVDGLTRENVASHFQKHRLYLKRMQGLSCGGSGVGLAASADPVIDYLSASSPVPPHFLTVLRQLRRLPTLRHHHQQQEQRIHNCSLS